MAYYEILRPVSAEDGSTIPAGTVVDASNWKNLHRLINMKRVRLVEKPVEQEVAKAPSVTKKAPKVVDAIEETPANNGGF